MHSLKDNFGQNTVEKEKGAQIMTVEAFGKFKKVRIKSLAKKYGMYRGKGLIVLDDQGITIKGKHVKSLGARWGIGIALMLASAVLTGGAVVLGFIPVYLLVEYAILKQDDIRIPWDKVRMFAVDPKKKLIGLDFDGPDWTSPAILYTEQFQPTVAELQRRIPSKESKA